MLTRDSWILGLTIVASVLSVILAQFDLLPVGWQDYRGAVTILASIIGVIAGVLRTSPLAGAKTPASDSYAALGGLVKMSDKADTVKIPSWILLLLLLPVVTACGPKTKPTLVKVDESIYISVKALHDTAVVLVNTKVITPQQELKIQEAILPVAQLGEQATRALDAWKSGPTPPELQALVREMGKLVTAIVGIIPQNEQAKAVLLEKIALAQQAVAAILVIIMGGV